MNEQRLKELLKECRMDNGLNNEGDKLDGLLELIHDHVDISSIIAEIGNYNGASTELFAMHCFRIYAIDPYDLIKQEWGQETIEQLKEAEKKFIKRVAKCSNINKIKNFSLNAIKSFKDNSLDIVYLDGDHRHQSIVNDIESWMPKVKIGGIISGHDYYEDCKDAIDSIIGKPDKVYKDSSWIKKINK